MLESDRWKDDAAFISWRCLSDGVFLFIKFMREVKVTAIFYCSIFKKFFSYRLLSVLRGHSIFIPATTANVRRLRRIFLSQILSITLILFSYFNSWERVSISVLSKGTSWYLFYKVFGMAVLVWGLTPGPPALDASTLPLGYRGGSYCSIKHNSFSIFVCRRK